MPYHKDIITTPGDDAPNQSQKYRYLERLLETFPTDQAVVLRLIESDATFREICEEYAACNEAVERLVHGSFDADMRKEYLALQLELEGELLRHILEHRSKGSNR